MAVTDLFQPDPGSPSGSENLHSFVSEKLNAFLREPGALSSFLSEQEMEQQFADVNIPEHGSSPDAYLSWLFEKVVPHAVRTHSPRFIGHMTSALPAFVDPLDRVMTVLNQNVVKLETSDAFTFYERQALGMLHQLVYGREPEFYQAHAQNRQSTLGMLVSGGTVANLAALWVARNQRLGPKGDFSGISVDGLAAGLAAHGYRRGVVIGSSLMHYSLRKAADVLGLGEKSLIKVMARPDGRVELEAVRKELLACRERNDGVMCLIGIAGTTETGAVDPLDELADIAAEFKVPFHVDAAWGGPALFSKTHRKVLQGIARADSVTIDGHKQLYLPMGIGMVVFKDPNAAQSIEKDAQYIVRQGSVDLGRRTLEGSRPAMALFLHGGFSIFGRAGYEQLVDGGIARAKALGGLIQGRPEFELLSPPVLNIVVYRYIPEPLRRKVGAGDLTSANQDEINRVNRSIQSAQWRGGATFVSRTTLTNTVHGANREIVALRSVLANPLSGVGELGAALDEQAKLGAAVV